MCFMLYTHFVNSWTLHEGWICYSQYLLSFGIDGRMNTLYIVNLPCRDLHEHPITAGVIWAWPATFLRLTSFGESLPGAALPIALSLAHDWTQLQEHVYCLQVNGEQHKLQQCTDGVSVFQLARVNTTFLLGTLLACQSSSVYLLTYLSTYLFCNMM